MVNRIFRLRFRNGLQKAVANHVLDPQRHPSVAKTKRIFSEHRPHNPRFLKSTTASGQLPQEKRIIKIFRHTHRMAADHRAKRSIFAAQLFPLHRKSLQAGQRKRFTAPGKPAPQIGRNLSPPPERDGGSIIPFQIPRELNTGNVPIRHTEGNQLCSQPTKPAGIVRHFARPNTNGLSCPGALLQQLKAFAGAPEQIAHRLLTLTRIYVQQLRQSRFSLFSNPILVYLPVARQDF